MPGIKKEIIPLLDTLRVRLDTEIAAYCAAGRPAGWRFRKLRVSTLLCRHRQLPFRDRGIFPSAILSQFLPLDLRNKCGFLPVDSFHACKNIKKRNKGRSTALVQNGPPRSIDSSLFESNRNFFANDTIGPSRRWGFIFFFTYLLFQNYQNYH